MRFYILCVNQEDVGKEQFLLRDDWRGFPRYWERKDCFTRHARKALVFGGKEEAERYLVGKRLYGWGLHVISLTAAEIADPALALKRPFDPAEPFPHLETVRFARPTERQPQEIDR